MKFKPAQALVNANDALHSVAVPPARTICLIPLANIGAINMNRGVCVAKTPNPSVNTDRLQAALAGSLRRVAAPAAGYLKR